MREAVHCTGHSSASAGDIWSVVSSFDVSWHPMVAWSEVEQSNRPEIIRRFQANGDDAVMREKLTYLSNSDRTLEYEMVSGIQGAKNYAACVKITPADKGTTLTWGADIDAPSVRAKEIAAGTRLVFEAGIAALKQPNPPVQKSPVNRPPVRLSNRQLGDTPHLGITVAPADLSQAGTICVFLHGIGGNRHNWDAQLTALGGQIPVVSLDLRGYGESTLGLGSSHIEEYAADVFSLLDHFRAKRIVLCGLSYGAWIAASIALRHPEKVAGLVVCGGCTGMSEADPDERDAFRISREVPLNAGQTPADFAPAVVDMIAGPNAPESVREELLASMAAIPPKTYRDALNCFCNPSERLRFEAADFPILLMTGEHDRLAPPDEIRAVSHRFAQAGAPFVNFEVIPNAGHVCNLEQPELVNAHLARFLDMLSPALKPATKVSRRSQKRARILAAALREFSKNGYSGASMQAIAKRAEVSKPTLYQYIGQKEDVFHAVLDQGQATILAPLSQSTQGNLIQVLWDFSWAYADYVLHPDTLSIARLIIAEAERVPHIARQFHDNGPARAHAGIASFLDQQVCDARLSFDDANIAAEHLWSLILSGPRNHALHFPKDRQSDEVLALSIRKGLEVFLRAYSTKPNEHLATLAKIAEQSTRRRKT